MISVCNSDQWQCDNGICIPTSSIFNGENDCGDNSDERKQIIMYKLNVTIYLNKIFSVYY